MTLYSTAQGTRRTTVYCHRRCEWLTENEIVRRLIAGADAAQEIRQHITAVQELRHRLGDRQQAGCEKPDDFAEKVLQYIASAGECTAKEIREICGFPRNATGKVLRLLCDAGKLTRSRGATGPTYYYRVAE